MEDCFLIDFLLEDDYSQGSHDDTLFHSKWLTDESPTCSDGALKQHKKGSRAKLKSRRKRVKEQCLDDSIEELMDLILKDNKLSLQSDNGIKGNTDKSINHLASKARRNKNKNSPNGEFQKDLKVIYEGHGTEENFAFDFSGKEDGLVTLQAANLNGMKKSRRKKKSKSSDKILTDSSVERSQSEPYNSSSIPETIEKPIQSTVAKEAKVSSKKNRSHRKKKNPEASNGGVKTDAKEASQDHQADNKKIGKSSNRRYRRKIQNRESSKSEGLASQSKELPSSK